MPGARQHITVELMWVEVGHLMVKEKQKRMRKRRGWGPNIPFEDMLLRT